MAFLVDKVNIVGVGRFGLNEWIDPVEYKLWDIA